MPCLYRKRAGRFAFYPPQNLDSHLGLKYTIAVYFMSSLAPEIIGKIGEFPITNSLLNAVLSTALFLVIALASVTRGRQLVPTGFHNALEAVIETLISQMNDVTNDKHKTRAFFPLVATIFLFLLVNNWMGLIPGVGSVGIWGLGHGGEAELIPLFRPAAADLNLTLALAVVSLLTVQFMGIKATGLINYFSKFVNIRGIFKAIKHGPMAIITAIIEFFVGLIEIVSEVAKVLSLSLRLFGNVFAGEVLIGVMMSLVSLVVPIPFMMLELLVGLIQATVFAMLVLVFLTVATESHGSEH